MSAKVLSWGLALAAACSASGATIVKQIVRQQWPWHEKVRIEYLLDCEPDEACVVDVAIEDASGARIPASSLSFSGAVGANVSAGLNVIEWDPACAGLDGSLPELCKFKLSVRHPIGPKYLILDVSEGNGETAVYSWRGAESYTFTNPVANKDALNTPCLASEIVFRRVEAGTYVMGSPESELGRGGNEQQHIVILTNDFYLAVLPTTQEHWAKVSAEGAIPTPSYSRTAPAQNISWAQLRNTPVATTGVAPDSWLGRLRAKTTGGLELPEGYVLDLPTEAQWEYACRAGTTTAWNSGAGADYYPSWDVKYGEAKAVTNTIEQACDHNFDALGATGMYKGNASYSDPNQGFRVQGGAVRLFGNTLVPNAWGFYEMHGNVQELTATAAWASGDVTAQTFDGSPEVEPRGGSRNYVMTRGGSWLDKASDCRAASRSNWLSYTQQGQTKIGFRLAIVKEVK